jgi:hypothetical protein
VLLRVISDLALHKPQRPKSHFDNHHLLLSGSKVLCKPRVVFVLTSKLHYKMYVVFYFSRYWSGFGADSFGPLLYAEIAVFRSQSLPLFCPLSCRCGMAMVGASFAPW